jgi:hypothetical protein
MWQAFVKVIPETQRPTLLNFSSDSERTDFCLGPMVYWYVFADDDDLFAPGSAWRKGGAWYVEPEVHSAPEPEGDDRW